MAYTINHGADTGALAQRRETATAALEMVKKLNISDRNGAALTVSDLEKLLEKENI